jgi:hypothetical protein
MLILFIFVQGTSRRFSRNNILDETDTCDEALRMRRYSTIKITIITSHCVQYHNH